MAADESVTDEGALYLVEDRLHTFEGERWPFDSGSCTPLKVCGTLDSVDVIRYCYYFNGNL